MNLEAISEHIKNLTLKEISNNPVSYNKDLPYQSYERIGLKGLRWSIEKRITEYGLTKYLNPNYTILDIGSHYGFMSIEFAHFCKLVHGIEPTTELVDIGTEVANFLGVSSNCRFFFDTFENFATDVKYDLILSLASFLTADGRQRGDAEEYFMKIKLLLTTEGILFYESTSYQKNLSNNHYLASLEAEKYICENFKIMRNFETASGSDGFFRKFIEAKKIN